MTRWQAERQQPHSRVARPGRCKQCAAPILRGLDADIAAFDATADPQPINPEDEPAVKVEGRHTYILTGRGDATTLWRRLPGTEDETRYPIHAEHKCQPQTEQPTLFEQEHTA